MGTARTPQPALLAYIVPVQSALAMTGKSRATRTLTDTTDAEAVLVGRYQKVDTLACPVSAARSGQAHLPRRCKGNIPSKDVCKHPANTYVMVCLDPLN